MAKRDILLQTELSTEAKWNEVYKKRRSIACGNPLGYSRGPVRSCIPPIARKPIVGTPAAEAGTKAETARTIAARTMRTVSHFLWSWMYSGQGRL